MLYREGGGARRAHALAAVALVGAVLVACSDGNGSDGADRASDGATGAVGTPSGSHLPALTATRGEHPAILDADGRQVLLRGVNVNSLADYAHADDDLAPTVAVSDDDWDAMAAEGFDAVRLLVSWSRLEPEPGEIDEGYVDEVRHAVRAAADRGMYTVLDMHQDAWGPHVATPAGTDCPAGREPAIGWDGAPAWATPDAGVNSCRGEGNRDDSELVREAWRRFYADEDGVRRHLVATWEELVAALAAEPGVGGYDLLNEPGHAPGDASVTTDGLAAYYREAIAAVRRGETRAGAPVRPKPIMFEYTVTGSPVAEDFSDDPALVFAPHVYGGSIAPLTVEQNWAYVRSLADGYHTALWIGEYGWFDDPAGNLAKVRTFGQYEDAAVVGSAWWQWRQACGDPHSVGRVGGTPADVVVEYRLNGCPGDRDLGVVPEWHEVVARPYPRAAPGHITSLAGDGARRTLTLAATGADTGATLDLWVPADPGRAEARSGDGEPDESDGEPVLTGMGIATVEARPIEGGWRLTARICAAHYEVAVSPPTDPGAATDPPDTCPS